MLKKLLFLGSGNLVVMILGFARNLAVALLISVADFGISSTFIVAFHLIQLLSFGGIHLIMVQADDGDSENSCPQISLMATIFTKNF